MEGEWTVLPADPMTGGGFDVGSAVKSALSGSMGAAGLLGTDTVTSRQDFKDALKNQFGSNWVVGFGQSKIDTNQNASQDATEKLANAVGGGSVNQWLIFGVLGAVAVFAVYKLKGRK